MFMALQDTTPRMGATTVCPGTHMCANEDLEWLCGDINSYSFEASSNGRTGKKLGLFRQGDAFLFNQNVWHRGPANKDPKHPDTNRVMFIMTFISRRDYEQYRDVRQLGWGTYYYMRWDQWGNSFADLKNAVHQFTTYGMGGFRALGLVFTKKVKKQLLGYTWVEHFCRQLATKEDFYAKWELPPFVEYLQTTLGVPKWLLGDIKKRNWDPFLRSMIEKIFNFATQVEYVAVGVAVACYGLLYVLASSNNRSTIRKAMGRLFLGHVILAVLAWSVYTAFWNSYLGQKISSGQIWDTPFPKIDAATKTTFHYPTTLPERMDVLIGSRFDAPFLGSFNEFLEYHPGNQHLNRLLQSFSKYHTFDLALYGLQQVWQEEPIQNVLPRMLLQDYTNGDWGVMTTDDTTTMLKRMILAKQNPLIGALWTHLKQALADSRFGHLRESAMKRIWTSQFVSYWQTKLFESIENSKPSKTKFAISPQASTTPAPAIAAIKKVLATSEVTKNLATTIPPVMEGRRRRRHLQATDNNDGDNNRNIPRNTYWTSHSKDLNILEEGDRVLAKYFDSTDYMEGIIRYIYDDEEWCLVQFVGDGSIAKQHIEAIQLYQPIKVGDYVEAIFADDDDWYPARIIHVGPFGTYDFQWEEDGKIEIGEIRSNLRLKLTEDDDDNDESSSLLRLRPHIGRRPDFVVGQTVYANFEESDNWFPGRIVKRQKKGTYMIQYDDGDSEPNAHAESIIPMYTASPSSLY